MYIEQGYSGKIELWKYLILPMGFIGLMVLNYISILLSPIPVDEAMKQMIDLFGKNQVLIINLGFLAFGLFLVWFWTKFVHKQSITSLTTSRKKVDFKRIFFAFFVWGGFITLTTLADIWYLNPEDYIFDFDWNKFLILLPIALLLVPLQTSFEEYLFRAHLMQGLGIYSGNRWMPLIVTSVLFGFMHIGNPEVSKIGYGILVFYVGTGFLLGISTLMDEGLELALGFHAANNLFGVLLVTFDWGALQADAIYKSVAPAEATLFGEIIVPVFIIFPLVLFIFSNKYKWTNWKDRLFGKVLTEAEFITTQDADSSAI